MTSSVQNKVPSFRFFFIMLTVIAFIVPLAGCDLAQNHLKLDREGSNEMQDYRDMMSSRVGSPEDGETGYSGEAPELQPYIAKADTNMKSMPLVSVKVNQTVPLKDVLYELAEQADYDLELDPAIRGAIIFTAKDRPFDMVVDRIAEIAGLRYKFDGDVLRVEVDTPYNELYKLDFLSYMRNNKTNISSDISVVSGDGADTGSGFESTSESKIDFWGELEANLKQILGDARSVGLKTANDPRISVTPKNPDVETVAPGDGDQAYEAPDAVLNVESLPVDDGAAASSGGSGQDDKNKPTFSLNKQAGIINVYANQRSHKQVQEYLKLLRKSVMSQVLIEAKILEVQLNDEFATGIDWSSLQRFSGKLISNFLVPGSAAGVVDEGVAVARAANPNGVFTGNSNFTISYAGDVQVLIEALSGFGTVKALASPRLTVLNNQPAVLNVSTNRVFFEIDIDVSQDGVTSQTDISSTINNVPEGVIVNVQPSINMDDSTISMAVRPTITAVVGQVPDPAVQFVTASAVPPIEGVESNIPELNVQEIDSVIQVRSGQPVVMGGLLQDRVSSVQEGVPVLGEVPVLGALFRDQSDLVKKTELVIFLKATILDTPSDSIHSTDKDLYRKFSSDRRPLRF